MRALAFTPLVPVLLRVTPQNNSYGWMPANHHAAWAAAAKQNACGVGVLDVTANHQRGGRFLMKARKGLCLHPRTRPRTFRTGSDQTVTAGSGGELHQGFLWKDTLRAHTIHSCSLRQCFTIYGLRHHKRDRDFIIFV